VLALRHLTVRVHAPERSVAVVSVTLVGGEQMYRFFGREGRSNSILNEFQYISD
jgi:hypothetical protein